jgi:hypothetical protein
MSSNYGKYPFVSLVQIKNYLNITSSNEDARLSNLLAFACGAVENYIGHEVLSNSYSEVFDGGKSSVFVSRLPLQNVHSVTEYDGTAYRRLNNPQTDGSSVTLINSNYTMTSSGGPILKTRYKKFGDSSAFFDGSDDFIYLADSDDWYFADSDFTIDMQVRSNSYAVNSIFMSQAADVNNLWSLGYDTTNGFTFRAVSAGTEVVNVTHTASTGYSANTFHHVEIVRSGSSWTLYRDGTSIGTQTTSNVMPDISAQLEIARQNVTSNYQYFNGFLDETRISHVARDTAAFTAPAYQHSTDDNTVFLSHFDGANDTATFQDDHATIEDFLFYPDTGEINKNIGDGTGDFGLTIIGASTFKNYPRGVRVTYKSGYDSDSVPQDLLMATMDYVKMLHKERQESQGFTFQGESVQNIALSANFPAHIRRILELYRVVM